MRRVKLPASLSVLISQVVKSYGLFALWIRGGVDMSHSPNVDTEWSRHVTIPNCGHGVESTCLPLQRSVIKSVITKYGIT